jgi:hypothetical protein
MTKPETEEDNGCTQIFRPPEIRQSRVETRRKRDATPEKGDAQIRKERKDSEKPEAGNRNRPIRGPEERGEGSSEAHRTKELRRKEAEPLTQTQPSLDT